MKIILTVDLLSIFQNFSKYSFIFGCFSKPKKVILLTSKCGEKVRIYHRQSSNSCSESWFHKIHTYQPILSHFGLFWSIFGLFLPILGFFGRMYCIALNYAFICLMKLFRSVISIVVISFAAKSRKTSIFADLANFRPVFANFGPYFVYFELLWKDIWCIALHYAFICHIKWSRSLISNIFINYAAKY